jgi:hypothetical protein
LKMLIFCNNMHIFHVPEQAVSPGAGYCFGIF